MASETPDIVKRADELEPPFYESSLRINRDIDKWIEAACDEITRLRATSSAAADEVGRLQEQCRVLAREVEAWRKYTDIVLKTGPFSAIGPALAEAEQARTATDASGAMKHKENGNG